MRVLLDRMRPASPASGWDAPRHIHVEISTLCNLDCRYCVLRTNMPVKTTMPLDRFRRLLPDLRKASSVSLSGLAEPLLNPDVIPIVEELKGVAPAPHISLFSNATRLTERLADGLITARLDSLYFSLDGVSETSVDGMRRGGRLADVIANIRALCALKRRHGSEVPHLAATMVLHRANYHELPDVVALARELAVERLDVNGLEPYTEDLVSEVLWHAPAMPHDLPDVLEAAVERAEGLGLSLGLAGLIPGSAECHEPAAPFILANGDVTACAVLSYERDYFYRVNANLSVRTERGRSRQRIFGNAFDQGLQAVWRTSEYTAFRRAVQEGRFPEECRHCMIKHRHICVRADVPARQVIERLRSAQMGEP